jgi:membrane associated rhomboid family serine protease
MAFRSNGPVLIALPPFRGVTRQILLIAVVCYLVMLVLGIALPDARDLILTFVMLEPAMVAKKLVWELVTYPFLGDGLLGLLLAGLSVWFFGSTLEDERGRRWMGEYFLVTTVVGGVLTCALAFALASHFAAFGAGAIAGGLWPFALSLVVAFAYLHPEEVLRFNFVFSLKAKYMAAIYVLLSVAMLLLGWNSFAMLLALCNAAVAYGYLRLAPRRGLRAGASEWLFGLRNAYYRNQRQRAAKKFVVYMRKQGKEVNLDAEGRYVDPDGTPRDINDRRWMN